MVTGCSQSRTATQNLAKVPSRSLSLGVRDAGFRSVALGSFRLCLPNYLGLCRCKAYRERAAVLQSACLQRLTLIDVFEKALLYLQNDVCDCLIHKDLCLILGSAHFHFLIS